MAIRNRFNTCKGIQDHRSDLLAHSGCCQEHHPRNRIDQCDHRWYAPYSLTSRANSSSGLLQWSFQDCYRSSPKSRQLYDVIFSIFVAKCSSGTPEMKLSIPIPFNMKRRKTVRFAAICRRHGKSIQCGHSKTLLTTLSRILMCKWTIILTLICSAVRLKGPRFDHPYIPCTCNQFLSSNKLHVIISKSGWIFWSTTVRRLCWQMQSSRSNWDSS